MEYTIVIANRNGAKSSKLITVAYIHMVECKIYLLYSQLGSDPERVYIFVKQSDLTSSGAISGKNRAELRK